MQHFTRTVGSCVRVLGLVDKLSKANAVSWSCSDITDKEARNFLQSSSLLLMQLQKSYPCYRDVMLPFSASLAQVREVAKNTVLKLTSLWCVKVIEGIQTLMCSTRSQSFSSDICSVCLFACSCVLHTINMLVIGCSQLFRPYVSYLDIKTFCVLQKY